MTLICYFFNRITKNKKKYFSKIYIFSVSTILFFIMALRHHSVGIDTQQYMFRYQNFPVELTADAFKGGETLFYGISTILSKIGVSFQVYLAIISFIIVFSFMKFYYKYSYNVALTLFLHVTIGSFAITMSTIRQSIAICIILFSFDALINRKMKKFIALVLFATLIHTSALFFITMYFISRIKIKKKTGISMIIMGIGAFFTRIYLGNLVSLIVPERYLKYGAFNEANAINMALVLIAFLIPIACLFFWKEIEKKRKMEFEFFSVLFIMSIINIFIHILALNSNMILRMSFYIMPFNILLITNIISSIRQKYIRIIAYIFSILLPLIQFAISTPEGTLAIDKYLFYWQ